MPITINSNVASLRTQRALSQASAARDKVFTHLSSGLRINRASDDAAGLAVSASLNVDSRVASTAVRNVNDGLSALSVAEGSLNELSSIVTRQKELAIQASSGTYSTNQRVALQKEANSLVTEFNRIVATTDFNGISILDPSTSNVIIQAGSGTSNSLSLAVSRGISRSVGNGTFGTSLTVSTVGDPTAVVEGDFNNDGYLDVVTGYAGLVNRFGFLAGNGDGTFRATYSFEAVSFTTFVLDAADINGDGYLDFVSHGQTQTENISLGNGDGTFKASVSFLVGSNMGERTLADVNRDGKLDLIGTSGTDGTIKILIGNGDGSFKARVSYDAFGQGNNYDPVLADFNGDNVEDLFFLSSGGNGTMMIMNGNGDGTFTVARTVSMPVSSLNGATAADINLDGIMDVVGKDQTNGRVIVGLGNGDGTFRAIVSFSIAAASNSVVQTADLTGDGYLDIVTRDFTASTITVFVGNGNGTFKAENHSAVSAGNGPLGTGFGDFNGDGAKDILVSGGGAGPSYFTILEPNVIQTSTMPYLDLSTRAKAGQSLSLIDEAFTRVLKETGDIGSFESRLSSVSSVLGTTSIEFRTAESRITDADVAQEAADLVRTGILQNAAAAVLAQANQQPKIALALLGVNN